MNQRLGKIEEKDLSYEVQGNILLVFSQTEKHVIGRFYARDVKVVKTNLTSETLKSSVKCFFEMHLKRRRLIRQTLNASVVFTVFILDVKVVSRGLERLRQL